MMGQLSGAQTALFYEFDLEEVVPEDHLLRRMDKLFDFEAVRKHLAPYYSRTGRPSIDPELMLRMLLVGYCYGIRSERRLCEEVRVNLAYRWFCRMSIEDKVPDHSTFSRTRHGRFRESDALRFVFERVVERCIDERLVSGEGFAVDASVIRADASAQQAIVRDDDEQWPIPGRSSRAVDEYIEALDEGMTPWKRVSTTDPQARWTAAAAGPAFFAYSTNYLVDTQAGVIVDVEASVSNRSDEAESTKLMIDRVERRFSLKPKRLIGDTAYGTAKMLNWLVEEQSIEPHVPVWEKSERNDGTFSRSDFIYDAHTDSYTCPSGNVLKARQRNFTRPSLCEKSAANFKTCSVAKSDTVYGGVDPLT